MFDLHRAQGPRVQEPEPDSRLEFRRVLISPTEVGGSRHVPGRQNLGFLQRFWVEGSDGVLERKP